MHKNRWEYPMGLAVAVVATIAATAAVAAAAMSGAWAAASTSPRAARSP
ncbi:MAG: hypothetical protein U0807_15660 [Candidatus Binatia bacterium]